MNTVTLKSIFLSDIVAPLVTVSPSGLCQAECHGVEHWPSQYYVLLYPVQVRSLILFISPTQRPYRETE